MKETVIQFKTEQEKITALQIYLSEKEGCVEKELTDYIDYLYKKYVPANVREYIEKVDSIEGDSRSSLPRRTTRRKPVCADQTAEGIVTPDEG